MIPLQPHIRSLRMPESPQARPSNLQLRLAVRIRTGNKSIRRHPVIRMRHPLLSSQQRQGCSFNPHRHYERL